MVLNISYFTTIAILSEITPKNIPDLLRNFSCRNAGAILIQPEYAKPIVATRYIYHQM